MCFQRICSNFTLVLDIKSVLQFLKFSVPLNSLLKRIIYILHNTTVCSFINKRHSFLQCLPPLPPLPSCHLYKFIFLAIHGLGAVSLQTFSVNDFTHPLLKCWSILTSPGVYLIDFSPQVDLCSIWISLKLLLYVSLMSVS